MYGVLEWPEEGRRERLEHEETVLGRSREAHIRISDMQVGRKHAAVIAQPDGRFVLRDLGSVNGTWFNGERVYERLLEPLDEFRLGGPQGSLIRFLLWDEEWDALEDDSGVDMSTGSLVLSPGTRPTQTVTSMGSLEQFVDIDASLPPDATKTAFINHDLIRRRHLQLLVEGFGVQTFELSPTSDVTIGRDRMRNVVCLDHRSVSVEHAVIRIDDQGRAVLSDLNSTNGTFVNGDRIEEPRALREGDRITFGHYRSRELIFRDSVREEVEVEAKDIEQGGEMVIGRDRDCDIVLNHVLISRRHARIEHGAEGYVIEDLDSANGTYVNGLRIERTPLHDNDRIQVGPFILQLQAGELRSSLDSSAIRIDTHALTRDVGTPAEPKRILEDINVSIGRRELVGVLGPSGSGKTTFLDAICGLQPATSGQVLFNGQDLYVHYGAARAFIGYVPQRDELHDELTLEQAMSFAARLRLPRDMGEVDRWEQINRLIDLLELGEHRDTRVGSLSGGQRKRVSIGIELLSQPGVLFVDEPTAGLDPRNQERMMYLFRRIASSGCTVVMATHQLGGFDLLDRAMVMAEGRMVYFGPVNQFYDYFDVNVPGDIYTKLETERSPEEWEQRFRETATHERFVERVLASEAEVQDLPPIPEAPTPLTQAWTLVHRYATQKLADRGSVITAVVQAPIIALLVIAIAYGAANAPRTLFMVVIAALWMGCSAGVREIVDEIAVYRRERLTFLKRWTYLASKVVVLGTIGLIQCLLFTSVLTLGGALRHHFVAATGVMVLLYLGGVAGGLAISAQARSAAAAMAAVPLVMFPQILFAGLLVPVGDVPMVLPKTVPEIVEQHQVEGANVERLRELAGDPLAGGVAAVEVDGEGKDVMGRFTVVTRGNRGVAAISTVMASRWGFEGLCHLFVHDPFELRVEDSEAYYQYQLLNSVYLSLYREADREELRARLLSGRGAEGTPPPPVFGFYLGILALHVVLMLTLTWILLLRRDAAHA